MCIGHLVVKQSTSDGISRAFKKTEEFVKILQNIDP